MATELVLHRERAQWHLSQQLLESMLDDNLAPSRQLWERIAQLSGQDPASLGWQWVDDSTRASLMQAVALIGSQRKVALEGPHQELLLRLWQAGLLRAAGFALV